MYVAVVTLDMSKLSGWLNAVVYCRVERRACVERTLNMPCMVVTLDVSKLSGWLNADADCRVERRACDAGMRRVNTAREA